MEPNDVREDRHLFVEPQPVIRLGPCNGPTIHELLKAEGFEVLPAEGRKVAISREGIGRLDFTGMAAHYPDFLELDGLQARNDDTVEATGVEGADPDGVLYFLYEAVRICAMTAR